MKNFLFKLFQFPDVVEKMELVRDMEGDTFTRLKFYDLPIELILYIACYLPPKDMISLARTCRRFGELPQEESFWRYQFACKWPHFYETFQDEKWGRKDPHVIPQIITAALDQDPKWRLPSELMKFSSWREAYKNVLEGKQKCILQIFKREKNHGFMRSYYDGVTSYIKEKGEYKIEYFPHLNTLSPAKGEIISEDQFDRMKVVPLELRHHNPFCVYRREGPLEPLAAGDEVEVQWRNNEDGAFGWWHGIVQSISEDKIVELVFKHYPTTSPWHLLRLPYGLQKPIPCKPSGWLGAIRKINAAEKEVMKSHFKKYD
jgi:hypothetical protein